MPVQRIEPDQVPAVALTRPPALPLFVRIPIIGTLLGAITFGYLDPIRDPDTMWHLATGEWLRQTWTFSGPDPWSDSSSNVWVLHEWLPELLMSYAEQYFGLPGVAWLHALTVSLLGLTLWVTCRRRAGMLISALVIALVLLGMSASLSARPHMFTFIFAVVTVDAWLKTSEDNRVRWWLIPLAWLWACSHGMWFLGVLVGLVTVLGMTLDRTASKGTLRRLAIVPAGSLVAAALTPAGPALVLAPLQVRGYTRFVSEWLPPSIAQPNAIAVLALAGLTVVIWSRRGVRIPWTRVLLVGLALGIALLYLRTLAVGAALLAPLAAEAIQSTGALVKEHRSRLETSLTVTLTAAGLLLAALIAPTRAASQGVGPSGLDGFLAALPRGTAVCNDQTIGGWMIWAHPNLRPAIDGRLEIYAVDDVALYQKFMLSAPGWEAYLDTTECTYAVFPPSLPIVETLQARSGWERVATADGFVLLRAPSA